MVEFNYTPFLTKSQYVVDVCQKNFEISHNQLRVNISLSAAESDSNHRAFGCMHYIQKRAEKGIWTRKHNLLNKKTLFIMRGVL